MTTEYIGGSLLLLDWVCTYGTISLDGDFRSVKITPSVNTVDGTAGHDTNSVLYMGRKSIAVNVELVTQTGGTMVDKALDAGVQGTLIVQPEGTAAGKPKWTIPCFSNGANYEWPFDDIAKITCDFSGQGNYTYAVN